MIESDRKEGLSFQFHSAVSVSALDLNSSLWRVTVMIREFQWKIIHKSVDLVPALL